MKNTTAAIILTLLTAGCVERQMTIVSDPPGATVYLDGAEIGRTPVTTGFTHYGDRGVRIALDDYETINDVKHVGAPYYQVFPFDLVADVFVPWTIKDQRYYPYKLVEAEPKSREDLIADAEEFREKYRAAIEEQSRRIDSTKMKQRRAEVQRREEQGIERKKWYRLFF